MNNKHTSDEPDVIRVIIDELKKVDEEGRERIIRYISDYFGLGITNGSRPTSSQQRNLVNASPDDRQPTFTDRAFLSPKEFIHEKQPHTGVERVACLAYYLAHFRDTPHFQTIDISKLNTEAAQLKFANAANSVSNAVESGLLVPAGKGKKQISAVGERFVDALPDREDAKAVLSRMRKRRSRKKPRNTKKARQVTK